jgi:glyoxylase-like metal-dependent hydrolase (beta-lactamase superfamily II)
VYAGINELPYLQLNCPILPLNENDIVHLGETQAKIINTPGHSAGGICYQLDQHIVVGDTLFVYGAGHCALPGASILDFFQTMQKLKTLPTSLQLLCGHDYGCQPTTTLGEQQQGNAFLLIKNKTDFIRYIEGMGQGVYPYPTKPITKKELDLML